MESPLNDNEQSEQETLDNYKTFVGGGPGPSSEAGQPGISACRASTLPDSAAERKTYPIASGVLDYFPDAIVAIAHVSQVGNDQHNPGQPLHWDRSKSTDEADTMQRHFLQRGTLDKDGLRHTAKMAWRALALLQKEIESELITTSTLYQVGYEYFIDEGGDLFRFEPGRNVNGNRFLGCVWGDFTWNKRSVKGLTSISEFSARRQFPRAFES